VVDDWALTMAGKKLLISRISLRENMLFL